jgi:hypothetical protein
MNKVSLFLLSILMVSLISCSKDEDEAPSAPSPVINSDVKKNTVKTDDHESSLSYLTFVKNDFGGDIVYSISAIENLPQDPTSSDYGDAIFFFFKVIPTANTTLNHFGNYTPLDSDQFYFSSAVVNDEQWYTPFVGDDPVGEMSVSIANGIATFTAENIVLSDNNVNPINATTPVSFSISVDVSYFSQDNTGFVAVSN